MIRRLPVLRHEPFLLGTGLARFIDELFRDFDRIGFDTARKTSCTRPHEVLDCSSFDHVRGNRCHAISPRRQRPRPGRQISIVSPEPPMRRPNR